MTPEEHELLSGVSRGTPMGQLLRRYWLPALLSREVETDGAVVKVRLLSEDLVAFRDSTGRVGLLGEHCAHRGASLCFANNADSGLRCWYHGWKYDVDGNCGEMPNEPPQSRFADKIKQLAYPCIERNGVVFTYMGPKEHTPGFPEIEWTLLPESHVYASKRHQECFWLQGLEGDIDSSHLGFLHGLDTIKKSTEFDMSKQGAFISTDSHPKLEVVQRPVGLLQASRRDADEHNFYWRIGGWFLPCFTMLPGFPGDSPLGGHAWVPVDDEHVMAFGINWHPKRPLTGDELRYYHEGTPTGIHSTLTPGTFIAKRNKSNGYADADAPPAKQPWQRITIFQDQDTAITESIGADFSRTEEHLGSTDVVIIQMRRRLLAAAQALKDGQEPPTDPEGYRMRGLCCILPRSTASWSEAVADAIDARPETFQLSV